MAVVALGVDRHLYVLRSEGLRESPTKWLEHAVRLARDYGATIIVEKNHGGAFLVGLLEQAMANLGVRAPYQVVDAGTSKQTRAEPVAMLYEQRPAKVHHVGHQPELEDQMVTFTGEGKSPDRLDALVWAMTSLMGYGLHSAGSSGAAEAVPWREDARGIPGAAVPWVEPEGSPFASPELIPYGRFWLYTRPD